MTVHDVEQRTEAWRLLRLGRLTGSRAKSMLATIAKGEAAARRDLRTQLALERITNQNLDSDYVNADMQWGTEHEGDARAAYEAATGELVTLVGFCSHPTLWAGTSPDGFVGEDGIVSLKCPRPANHFAYLKSNTEPAEHAAQNTHELWLTGRAWIDFVSFDPRFPEGAQLFRIRVTRTPAELAAYEVTLRAFLAEVDREVEAIQTLTNLSGQLQKAVGA